MVVVVARMREVHMPWRVPMRMIGLGLGVTAEPGRHRPVGQQRDDSARAAAT